MATKFLDYTGLSYFCSKIKSWVTSRGYITSSDNITGNAATATKLATARSISAGDLEFQGSANFDGSNNINLNVTNHRSIVNVGNTNNYPFHRIAYIPTLTGGYLDRGITFLINKDYPGGGWGICRIILRADNATEGETATCSVQWLIRSDEISADSIQAGFCNTANASYVDVFYKSEFRFRSAICRVLAHSNTRNYVGRGFTVVNESIEVYNTTEVDPKTSVESYKTIADAGTTLHSQPYTDIIVASDVGVTGQAEKLSSSRTISLTGDVSGSASFDGSANASITATVDDSNYVHKTGNEVIGGVKEFTEYIYDRNNNLERGNYTSSSGTYGDILAYLDKNRKFLYRLYNAIPNSSCNYFSILVYPIFNTDNTYTSLEVGYDTNSVPFASAPSTPEPSARNAARDIVTRDFIPKDTRIVHTTGDETINGNKTFTNAVYCPSYNITIPSLKLDANNPILPSQSYYKNINYFDVNNTKIAHIQYACYVDGGTKLCFGLWNMTGSQSASLDLRVDADGKKYATAPDPTSFSMDSTQIATTYWVRRATGNTTLNAASASKLLNARTISLSGILKGSVNFDGTDNVDIAAALNNKYVGTGDSTNTDKWYKAFSYTCPFNGFVDPTLICLVHDSYSPRSCGILFLHARSDGTGNFPLNYDGGYDFTLVDNYGLDSSRFCVVVQSTDTKTIEIWCKYGRQFNVVGFSVLYSNLPFIQYSRDDNLTPVSDFTGHLSKLARDVNYIKLTGDQNVNGVKTFFNNPRISNNAPFIDLYNTYVERGVGVDGTGSNGDNAGITFRDKNSSIYGLVTSRFYGSKTDKHIYTALYAFKSNASSDTDYFSCGSMYWANGAKSFNREGSDVALGMSGRKWKEVWCDQSSLNSSSDERLKEDIILIPDDVLNAWENVNWVRYKFKKANSEKNGNARYHTGAIAQQIDKAFKDKGLDVSKYGLFLYDEWDAVPEVRNEETGNIIQKEEPAGNEYGLRYVEALCMEAAYQRRKNKILENRISELETQVQNMLQILESLKGA